MEAATSSKTLNLTETGGNPVFVQNSTPVWIEDSGKVRKESTKIEFQSGQVHNYTRKTHIFV
jgi:hypothetical protein